MHITNGDAIEIQNQNNFHIIGIEVFTGDDDANETDLVEITTANNKLVVKKTLSEVLRKSKTRLRGEPGVRIYLEGEGSKNWVLSIGHHKGSILTHLDPMPAIGVTNVV